MALKLSFSNNRHLTFASSQCDASQPFIIPPIKASVTFSILEPSFRTKLISSVTFYIDLLSPHLKIQ